MTQQNHLRGVLLASSACILWGISVAASTLFINNPHLTAMWLTQVRMISAGLILLVWGMVAGKHPFKIWHHRHAAWTAVSYGLLGLIPVQLCYFEAVRVGNAPIATIIQFLGPFIISIYYFLFKHVTPSRIELIGADRGFIGTFIDHDDFRSLKQSGNFTRHLVLGRLIRHRGRHEHLDPANHFTKVWRINRHWLGVTDCGSVSNLVTTHVACPPDDYLAPIRLVNRHYSPRNGGPLPDVCA